VKRSESGKTLDRFVFGSIIVGVSVGLYAGWVAGIAAVIVFVIALVYGTRLWVALKILGPYWDERRKIERGEPLEPEPAVKPIVLQAGTKVRAVHDFWHIKDGAPGIITGVADVPGVYPGGPVYTCTFADNATTTARPNDISEDDHGYTLQELQQPF
jgi:hypothetical protein